MPEWGPFENILHWVLICVIWGILSSLLRKKAKKSYEFDLFKFNKNLRLKNYLICLGILAICITMNMLSWNGFKLIEEFQNNGTIQFLFQHLYYVFEIFLVFLIIAFGQESGERYFKSIKIPWGGILVGLTWGLSHILTRGDLMSGLFTALFGALFGVIYLAAEKNPYVSYTIILLGFVL